MSDSRAQNPECPLCMEPFEVDDFSFFPCTCGYQICRFCWHRIRTDENGLCPACRKQYPEDPADFKPLSVEELQKIKIEKRQKDQQKKNEMSENRKHLSGVRVVQKNLVFVVGLPTRLADTEVLKKHDYFGKFGKIQKVTVNQSTNYAGYQGPSASAYVTYCKSEDALQAIKAVNNLKIDGRVMKASLGTTKYCSHFLKNRQCRKADCVYLHELGDEVATGKKKDISTDIASPTAQKKPQLCKEVCPSPPQNSKLEQAKESLAVKQPHSKSKNASSEGQKRKVKDKSDHLSNSKISTIKNTKNREGSCLKSNSKPEKLSKDCNSSPSPMQRAERSVCRNIVSDNKHSLNGMNSKNVQKTEVHISEQSVQSTFRASSVSPSDPPSPTSSSSSSLFTPFGSLSSNFLSSSPSSHSSDHMLFSAKESSQFEESINRSRNNLPQDFMDTAAGKTECVTLSSVESAMLSNKLNALTLPASDPFSSDPTYEEDFDPYEESSKGLADLIAKEEAHCIPYDTATIPPGFSSVNTNRPVQRITPPPGFDHKEMTEEDLANMFMKTKLEIHQAMSSCNRQQDQPIPMSNYPQDNCGVSEEQLLRAKKLEDELRAIFPNATVTFGYHEKDNLDVPSAEILADSARCPPPYIPTPEMISWMPPGAVAENALGGVPSAEIFADSVRCPPCIPRPETTNWLPPGAVAENTLGGHWLPYSQFPPPGFLRPYISAPFIPFQHFGANYSETESGHDSIDRRHSSV